MMWEDPIVSEVRCIREELAAQFNFDVGAIFEDMRKRQAPLGSRLIRREKKDKPEQASAPDRNSAPLHPGR
jgi:hypothetical protein